MSAGDNGRVLGRNASVLLDVLRFAAAVAVALTHLGGFFVRTGPIVSEHAGNTAVCVFFVLSGFVIRYVTTVRETMAREYAIDRMSRIYSVVIPCLLLTVVLEGVALRFASAGYRSVLAPVPWADVPLQIVQNLSFTVGWWGLGSTPLSNGPFWSLPFECVYYVLYGVLRYGPKARWWLVPLCLLVTGPAIALSFPVWWLGVWLYDGYAALRRRRGGLLWSGAALLVYATGLWVERARVLQLLRATSVGEREALVTRTVASLHWGRVLFHGQTLHWLNHFSVSYLLTGSLLAVAMLPVLLLIEGRLRPVGRGAAEGIRRIADSTFTLYLFHMPFLLFLVSFHGGPFANWRQGTGALLLTMAISVGLAMSFDRLKNAMRAGMRGTSVRKQAQPVLR